MTCSPKSVGTDVIQRIRGPHVLRQTDFLGITTKNNQNLLFGVWEHDVCVCVPVCIPVCMSACVCMPMLISENDGQP